MGHLHNVYDTDKHFVIDRVTKTIKDMSDSKTTLAQYDHNSERFTFELPRFIDGHDMSLCNRVRVHYINESEDKQNSTPGLYEVKDLHISEDADDIVLCSWLISQNATQFAGPLMFCIEFSCVSEDAVVEYSWHTAVHTWVSVGKGIRNSEAIVDMYADILEQWERDLLEASRGGDWEATKDDPGYILNKPFGEEVYDLIPYYTFFFTTQTPPTDYWGDPNWCGAYLTDRVHLKPKPGLNCSILLEGNEYVCECIDVNGDGSVLLLGNEKWNGGNDNGLPFAIVFAYGETAIRIDRDAQNISGYAAVMVKGPQVKMIDPKFIPPSDWEAQSYDPGYIRNKPFGDVREVLVNKDEQRVYQYLTASSHWPDKEEWFGATILEFTMPEVGGIYIVTYQGQEYVCECIDRDGDGSVLLLGDPDGVKSINDIYPFTLTFSEKECILLANTDFTYIPDKGYFVKIRAGREYTERLDARFLPAGIPYVEGEYVTILPETEIPFTENIMIFEYNSGLNVEAGKEYSVNWNGTTYKCIAQTLPSTNMIGLGDLSGNGGSANGEPFTIHTDETQTFIFPMDGSTTLTLGIYEGEIIIHKIDPRCLPDGYAGGESGGSGESGGAGSGTVVVREGADWNAAEGEPGHILNKPDFEWIPTTTETGPAKMPVKFLPDGVPYAVPDSEVLPLTEFAYYEGMNAFVHTQKISLTSGAAYTVVYNGQAYACVCKHATFQNIPMLALGNLSVVGGEDTGEPFSFGLYGDDIAAQFGGIYLGVFALDGAESVEMAIYGESIRKLDNRCLNLDWLPTVDKYELVPEFSAITGSEPANLGGGMICYGGLASFGINSANIEALGVPLDTSIPVTMCVNGTEYAAAFSPTTDGDMFVSNAGFAFIYVTESMQMFYGAESETAYTVSVYAPSASAYNKLPEEFLPESVSGVVIRSSTEGSTKKFKLTVDDSGTVSTAEVT